MEDAKPVVQQEMIDAGQAFMYYEPNGQVISRSGDECVVTFSDQWYLTYGEKGWKEPVMDYIKNNLETFNPKTKQALEASCDWLSSWAWLAPVRSGHSRRRRGTMRRSCLGTRSS